MHLLAVSRDFLFHGERVRRGSGRGVRTMAEADRGRGQRRRGAGGRCGYGACLRKRGSSRNG